MLFACLQNPQLSILTQEGGLGMQIPLEPPVLGITGNRVLSLKCIFPNYQIYLSKSLNIFLIITKYICPIRRKEDFECKFLWSPWFPDCHVGRGT